MHTYIALMIGMPILWMITQTLPSFFFFVYFLCFFPPHILPRHTLHLHIPCLMMTLLGHLGGRVLRYSSSARRPFAGDHGSRPLTSLYPKVVFNLMARDCIAHAALLHLFFVRLAPGALPRWLSPCRLTTTADIKCNPPADSMQCNSRYRAAFCHFWTFPQMYIQQLYNRLTIFFYSFLE